MKLLAAFLFFAASALEPLVAPPTPCEQAGGVDFAGGCMLGSDAQ